MRTARAASAQGKEALESLLGTSAWNALSPSKSLHASPRLRMVLHTSGGSAARPCISDMTASHLCLPLAAYAQLLCLRNFLDEQQTANALLLCTLARRRSERQKITKSTGTTPTERN